MFCWALNGVYFLQDANVMLSSCKDKESFGFLSGQGEKNSSEIFQEKLDRNIYEVIHCFSCFLTTSHCFLL